MAASLVGPSAAQAAPDLAGRWVSDSLRDNQVGYFLVLRDGASAAYRGHLRFEYRDGRRNARMPVTVTVAGNQVLIRARSGVFDKSGSLLRGQLDAGASMLRLTNCTERLRLVMSWDLDSDCVLRLKR
jgi:hypothetical protein